ncbi:hypothetical protein [Micromonospora wenchangensis]|uniref:hypothetical protein n=1 Tax=Micromonospora wenchangensis TaxID=1185415 RepID=UPI00342D5BF2
MENLGDRPILGLALVGQVASWEMHDPQRKSQRPLLGDRTPYLSPGGKHELALVVSQVTHIQLSSCVVSWEDADGRYWRRDIDPAIANQAADRQRRLNGMTPTERMREMFGYTPELDDDEDTRPNGMQDD